MTDAEFRTLLEEAYTRLMVSEGDARYENNNIELANRIRIALDEDTDHLSTRSVLVPPYRYEVSDHGPATIYDAIDVGWVARIKESLPYKAELAAIIVELLNDAAVEACTHPSTSFDRSICACGSMHDYCETCGMALDCPLDQ